MTEGRIEGTCAACGRRGHRFGTTHGPDAPDRWNPIACINGLLGEIDDLKAAIEQHREDVLEGAECRHARRRLWAALDGRPSDTVPAPPPRQPDPALKGYLEQANDGRS